METEVQQMLAMGFIDESHSPWRSAPLFVTKASGSVLFCIAFHKLNDMSVFDAYPIPRVDTFSSLSWELNTYPPLISLKVIGKYPQTPPQERKPRSPAPQDYTNSGKCPSCDMAQPPHFKESWIKPLRLSETVRLPIAMTSWYLAPHGRLI